MPFFAVEGAIDHIAGVGQRRRQLTVEIRIVFNDEQAQGFPPNVSCTISAIKMNPAGVNGL